MVPPQRSSQRTPGAQTAERRAWKPPPRLRAKSLELCQDEVRRINLLRGWVNRVRRGTGAAMPDLFPGFKPGRLFSHWVLLGAASVRYASADQAAPLTGSLHPDAWRYQRETEVYSGLQRAKPFANRAFQPISTSAGQLLADLLTC